MPAGSVLTLKLLPRFDLARTVCSYGYFMLAPNRWLPGTRQLQRPLRGEDDRPVGTLITQRPRSDVLRIACDTAVARTERAALVRQVTRMLRLNEPIDRLRDWHRLSPAARRAGFGRLFRSPTLFEDIVKTITGCNVTWSSTMRMNRLLCERAGDTSPSGQTGFPTPARLARARPDWLRRHCKVGYRAGRIVRLARAVAGGRLDLDTFDDPSRPTDEVFRALKSIHGIGDYAAGNLCQVLGRYDRLAIDTETYRLFEQSHGLERGDNPLRLHPRIEAHYARFAPYQFLAYWFDIWTDYERRFGRSWTWDPDVHGPNFTASKLRERA